jgi:hypothetical protein
MKEERRIGQNFQSLLEEIEKDLSGNSVPEPQAPWWNRDRIIKNPHVSTFRAGDIIQVWKDKGLGTSFELLKIYYRNSTDILIEFFNEKEESISLGSYWTNIISLQNALNLANHYIIIGNEKQKRTIPDKLINNQSCSKCRNKFKDGQTIVFCQGEYDDWHLQCHGCKKTFEQVQEDYENEALHYDASIAVAAAKRRANYVKRILSHTRTPGSIRRLLRRANQCNSSNKRRGRH